MVAINVYICGLGTVNCIIHFQTPFALLSTAALAANIARQQRNCVLCYEPTGECPLYLVHPFAIIYASNLVSACSPHLATVITLACCVSDVHSASNFME